MLLRHSPSNEAYFYVSQLYADPIFYLIQKTQPGGRMPEADSSDIKKRVSALQPPVRPAASRHKKFQETNSIRLFNRVCPCVSPSRPGIKKGPAASLLQDLFKTATTYSPTCAVPSAWRGLTSLFGMGRGGSPAL